MTLEQLTALLSQDYFEQLTNYAEVSGCCCG